MEYYKNFEIKDDLLRKSKVEIGKVLFTNWSHKSNFPKNAVMKRYLSMENRGIEEAEMMIRVNSLHPWTVKYYASGVYQNSQFYILMEDCIKGDLRKEIKEKRSKNRHFSVEALVYYFSCLTDVIEVLHINSIWHRDIKPQNIFINENGDLRLGDYGISKFSEKEELPYTFHTILGTVPYMSPELKTRRYMKHIISSPDSDDIWALGMTFYEMVTFERISIQSDIDLEIRNAIISRRWCPQSFITLLSGMLDPIVPKRWKIEQVRDWLAKFQSINKFRHNYYKTNEIEEEEEEESYKKSEESIAESETISIESQRTSSDSEKRNISKKDSEAYNPDLNDFEPSDPQNPTSNYLSSQSSSSTLYKLEIASSCNSDKVSSYPNEISDTNYEPSIQILSKLFHKKEIHPIKQFEEEKKSTKLEKCKDILPEQYKTPIMIAPMENKSHRIDEKEAIFRELFKENQEKIVCRICKAFSWTKLHPQHWRPYKIKCKKCKSNYCSFCNYGGGHKKCQEYEDLLLGIKTSIFNKAWI
ncbi:unnamed protein product [Blepharisma stoltei]|uniref:non-specific serine/threonine protein kinase n=1 Tax=Blepharisma stoltei TaxID=1481888 RepID=A0AAU9JNH7_9CILI|nr:unnamed protein product [Blepharisma stoltei]